MIGWGLLVAIIAIVNINHEQKQILVNELLFVAMATAIATSYFLLASNRGSVLDLVIGVMVLIGGIGGASVTLASSKALSETQAARLSSTADFLSLLAFLGGAWLLVLGAMSFFNAPLW